MSRQKINLKREIKTLKGETYSMSYPSKSDLEAVKKAKGIENVKTEDLPNETVQNVIINSLAGYDPDDKKEVFLINQVANWAMGEPEKDGSHGELKDKLYNFLVEKVLPSATVMKKPETQDQNVEKSRQDGLYYAWVMSQVYDELGVVE